MGKKVIKVNDINEGAMSDNDKSIFIKQKKSLEGTDNFATLLVIFNAVVMGFNDDILGHNVMVIAMIFQAIALIYLIATRYKAKSKIKQLVTRYMPKNESSRYKIACQFEILNTIVITLLSITTVFMITYLILLK